jgi:DNA-directed RNA polymerase subunit RPC12/RpoP
MKFRYIYKCEICSREYIEHRLEEDNQVTFDCQCTGKFILEYTEPWE